MEVVQRPFSKIKAIITPEFKARGQAAMDAMMNRVLKPEMLDLSKDDLSSKTSSSPPSDSSGESPSI